MVCADYCSTLSLAIKDDLRTVQTGLTDLKEDTTTLVDTTSKIKTDTTILQDHAAMQRKKELLEWICLIDYHEQHRDYLKRHHVGTGQWFLQDTKFREWIQSGNAILFCPGIPGAGKTIMAALVIEHLLRTCHSSDSPVVFIYCDYKRQGEQSFEHMLSTLLRQIVDIRVDVPKTVHDLLTAYKTKGIMPSVDEIKQALGAISNSLHELTIVVDALDECEPRARRDLLQAVETLHRQGNVRYLATSRYFPEIESHSAFCEKPKLEVRASDEDLEKYIRSRASELHRQVASNPDLLENLVSSTVNATGGMYVQSFLQSLFLAVR